MKHLRSTNLVNIILKRGMTTAQERVMTTRSYFCLQMQSGECQNDKFLAI